MEDVCVGGAIFDSGQHTAVVHSTHQIFQRRGRMRETWRFTGGRLCVLMRQGLQINLAIVSGKLRTYQLVVSGMVLTASFAPVVVCRHRQLERVGST